MSLRMSVRMVSNRWTSVTESFERFSHSMWSFSWFVLTLYFSVVANVSLAQGVTDVPDPRNLRGLIPLARNESVARELKLERSQEVELRELLESNGGDFETFRERGNVSFDLLKKKLEEKQSSADARIVEIFDPDQIKRMSQLGYQMEIYRVGFGPTALGGYFGSHLGITASQKDAMRSKLESLDKEFSANVNEQYLLSFAKLSGHLSTLSLTRARDLVGPGFLAPSFRVENTWKKVKYPFSKVVLASLIEVPEIAKEVPLDFRTLESVRDCLKDYRNTMRHPSEKILRMEPKVRVNELQKRLDQVNELLDEKLGPEGFLLLRSLAVRLEIATVGLGKAITHGALGQEIGLSKGEIDLIGSVIEEVDKATDEAIGKLAAGMLSQFVEALPSDKIATAKNMLGKEFVFVQRIR
jgi:hypothetical protein